MNILFAMLSILLIQGCAPKSLTVFHDEDKENFKSSKVASSYYMVQKNVNYSEVLYRVLWVENRSSSMDFSGIWQPDGELSLLVNNQLREVSINAIRITELIDKKVLDEYYFAQVNPDFQPYISGVSSKTPVTEYLNKYPTYTGFEKIRNKLLEKNVRFYFEVLSSGAYGNAIGFGTVIAGATAYMRIIDLEHKKVLWSAAPLANKFNQIAGDLNKLEENNLALLKEGVKFGLKDAMDLVLKDVTQ